MDELCQYLVMNELESRLRNFLRHKHSIITKQTDAVANTQYLDEFSEFYALPGKIYMYREADIHNRRNRQLIFSLGDRQSIRYSARKPPISNYNPFAPFQYRRR
jgi:hypothetical protein